MSELSVNLVHLVALIKKEWLQILRDKSVLAAAFFMPILLLFIYGYGLNMDVRPVRVTLVATQVDPLYLEVKNALTGSDYFEVFEATSLPEAQLALRSHRSDAFLFVPAQADFVRGSKLYAAINGSQALMAQLALTYLQSALAALPELRSVKPLTASSAGLRVQLEIRSWFNPENQSVFYLMPGQFIGILSLVCNVMSSLVIARECTRGTLESLFAAQVSFAEIILSKLIPYLVLSLASAMMLIILIELIFELPVRGSVLLLILTLAVYALSCCLMGLWLSALVRDQFLACEYAIILSFLPAILLSGAVFDLRSLPLGINILGSLLHPTYAVQSVKICFLSGGSDWILWRNLGIIGGYALLFACLCFKALSSLRRG